MSEKYIPEEVVNMGITKLSDQEKLRNESIDEAKRKLIAMNIDIHRFLDESDRDFISGVSVESNRKNFRSLITDYEEQHKPWDKTVFDGFVRLGFEREVLKSVLKYPDLFSGLTTEEYEEIGKVLIDNREKSKKFELDSLNYNLKRSHVRPENMEEFKRKIDELENEPTADSFATFREQERVRIKQTVLDEIGRKYKAYAVYADISFPEDHKEIVTAIYAADESLRKEGYNAKIFREFTGLTPEDRQEIEELCKK